MNNNQVNIGTTSSFVRPKVVQVSSEDVLEFQDASQLTINLRDPIRAMEGFYLSYGVRSFGYNSTVQNINTEQRNNQILIQCVFREPRFIFKEDPQFLEELDGSYPTWGDAQVTGYWILNPKFGQTRVEKFPISLISGYYTFEDLLTALSSSDDFFLYSGLCQNQVAESANYSTPPIGHKYLYKQAGIAIPLRWSVKTSGGFTITLTDGGIEIFKNYHIFLKQGGTVAPAYVTWAMLAPLLQEIQILPDPDYPLLYNILFYNQMTRSNDDLGSTPDWNQKKGVNPPMGIKLSIYYAEPNISGIPATSDTTETVKPFSEEIIYFQFSEIGNETNEAKNPHVPFEYGVPYVFYYTPTLNPIYIDVSSSLSGSDVRTKTGQKSILLRQFVTGSESGVNSYYFQYDNPIYWSTDSDSCSSISLKFSSENDMWTFYNISFTLELIFYETKDEKGDEQLEVPYHVPASDPITSTLQQYTSSGRNPLPFNYTPIEEHQNSRSGKRQKHV